MKTDKGFSFTDRLYWERSGSELNTQTKTSPLFYISCDRCKAQFVAGSRGIFWHLCSSNVCSLEILHWKVKAVQHPLCNMCNVSFSQGASEYRVHSGISGRAALKQTQQIVIKRRKMFSTAQGHKMSESNWIHHFDFYLLWLWMLKLNYDTTSLSWVLFLCCIKWNR